MNVAKIVGQRFELACRNICYRDGGILAQDIHFLWAYMERKWEICQGQ